MFRYVATLLYAYSAVALGAAYDLGKVNGSIAVGQGERAGDVSTVNGSISVGPSTQVGAGAPDPASARHARPGEA